MTTAELREAILVALQGGPLPVRELAACVGVRPRELHTAINRLRWAGRIRITREAGGVRSQRTIALAVELDPVQRPEHRDPPPGWRESQCGAAMLRRRLLEHLAVHGPATSTEIARALLVGLQSLHAAGRLLEGEGLIERIPSKRRMTYHVTDAGRARIADN